MYVEELVEHIQKDLKTLVGPGVKQDKDAAMARIAVMSAALSALSANEQATALRTLAECQSNGFFDVRLFNQ